jgi:hypothetical protein
MLLLLLSKRPSVLCSKVLTPLLYKQINTVFAYVDKIVDLTLAA